jgi:hypothetical protein
LIEDIILTSKIQNPDLKLNDQDKYLIENLQKYKEISGKPEDEFLSKIRNIPK